MAVTYGFYDSLNHDRLYNAQQMSAIFDGIINDGVFMSVGNQFHTVAGTGMQVIVKSGRAWFDSTWTLNDAEYPLSIDAADVLLTRIDAVVLEVNSEVATRANTIKVVKGTPASTPAKPTLTNTATIHQHALAYVTVAKNTTAITNSMIEIVVGKTETPYVTAILQTTDITDLFNQWEDYFQTWFDTVRGTLDGDVALNLQNQITTLERSILKADTKTAMGLPSDAVGDDAFKYLLNKYKNYKIEVGRVSQAFWRPKKYWQTSDFFETPESFIFLDKSQRGSGYNDALYSFDAKIYPKDGTEPTTINLHPIDGTETGTDEGTADMYMDSFTYTLYFFINISLRSQYDSIKYAVKLSTTNNGKTYTRSVVALPDAVRKVSRQPGWPSFYVLNKKNESYPNLYIANKNIVIYGVNVYNASQSSGYVYSSTIVSVDPNYIVCPHSKPDSNGHNHYKYMLLNMNAGTYQFGNFESGQSELDHCCSYSSYVLCLSNDHKLKNINILTGTSETIFTLPTNDSISYSDVAVINIAHDDTYIYILTNFFNIIKCKYSSNGFSFDSIHYIRADLCAYQNYGAPYNRIDQISTSNVVKGFTTYCATSAPCVLYWDTWVVQTGSQDGTFSTSSLYYINDNKVLHSPLLIQPIINNNSEVLNIFSGNTHKILKIPCEEYV